MFKVTLINSTPFALETLIFTKGTRLSLDPEGFEAIKAWPMEKKLAELEYMRHTIQSQFEFVDFIFSITGVSRAFTQQLERHRIGTSFAEKALRVLDMSGFEFVTGPSIDVEDRTLADIYDDGMKHINGNYQSLLRNGARPQDARGILPINIATGIVFKGNLRTLHDMGLKRLCVKAQGEFQDVFRAIRAAVLAVHPYFDNFIRVWCATYGTCQFHTFPVADCPTKPYVYNPEATEAYGGGRPENLVQIQARWETNRAEAQPVVAPVKFESCTNGHDYSYAVYPAGKCRRCGRHD